MKKVLKWVAITLCVFVLLFIGVLLIAPSFINISKYKPLIEETVTKAVNRPFSIKGDLRLNLFPVTCLSFSDLHLGNPKGFKEKDFISIKSFDVEVKLLPFLFSKELQVKRFVMNKPNLILIKRKDGKTNWEFKTTSSASKDGKLKNKNTELKKTNTEFELPFKKISVDEFAITDAAILWIDQISGKKTGITGVNLRLKNISFVEPIGFELTAKVEGNPVKIEGQIGPLGEKIGKKPIPVAITLTALKELSIALKGKIKDVSSKNPAYEFDVRLSPFSPKRLLAKLGSPIRFTDPKALQKLSLSAYIKGNTKEVSISNGLLTLDQSKMRFLLNAKEFQKPNLAFNIDLDQIEIDRYIPVKQKKKSIRQKKATKPATSTNKKIGQSDVSSSVNYAPLRKLEIDGQIRIGKLIVKKIPVQDIYIKLLAKKGIFQIRPASMNTCGGKVLLNARADVSSEIPKTKLTFSVKNLLIGKLVKSILKEELLSGNLQLRLFLSMKGDTPDRIISSLNGDGDLLIKDGYITGIDLSGMIQNIKAAFGLAQARKLKKRTIFSEIRSKFYIKNGIFHTKETHLISPHLKVSSKGSADLKKQTLSFRITPEYIKNPETSIAVPVIVSGTFSSPIFAPDLKAVAKKFIFKKLIKEEEEKKETKEKSLKEIGRELLKGLFGQ